MTQSICPHCRDTYPDFDVAHVCSRGPYAPKLKAKMNNRIKELALQSADEIADLFNPGFFDDRMVNDVAELNKKLAELIVEECIGVVEGGSFLHDQAPTAIFARECSGAIKRHFGVEE
jgi:hypothetical protein